MNKIATTAAALSLFVGASPAFALLPNIPSEQDIQQSMSSETVVNYDDEFAYVDESWSIDLGWEKFGETAAGAPDLDFDFHDGLTFEGDGADDLNAGIEPADHMPI